MAVKTYQRHFGISYEYKDSNTGETENIPFVANAKLLILFKTITGVEMSKALDDYKNSIGNVYRQITCRQCSNLRTQKRPTNDSKFLCQALRSSKNC